MIAPAPPKASGTWRVRTPYALRQPWPSRALLAEYRDRRRHFPVFARATYAAAAYIAVGQRMYVIEPVWMRS